MMEILIIEDEIKTAKELKNLIETIDQDIKVIDILQSVTASVKWMKEHPSPDLIFSDIQLGDGLSFDIYREVQVNSPVIFCTAFDEYAIRAFEVNSVDYLLKPIDEQMLKQSLEKYSRLKDLFGTQQDIYQQRLIKLTNQLNPSYKQSILVYFKDQIIPVKTTEIRFIYAAHGVVYIQLNDDREFNTQHTMEQLEMMLNPQQFFRANRQFILNRSIIISLEPYFNRRLFVRINCESPEKIIVSKVKSNDFLEWVQL